MNTQRDPADLPLNLDSWCLDELERHPDCGSYPDEPSLEDSVIIIQAAHRATGPKSTDRELTRTPFPEPGSELPRQPR
ncbi:MAG: hypothetical protein KDA79_23720 [Planctomycetaceae bacterium]|nr:hypothetical protein [Planctomycetaceae bacterium]